MRIVIILACLSITALAQLECQIVGSEIDSNNLALLHVNTYTSTNINLYQDTQTKASRYYDKTSSEFSSQQDADNWLTKYEVGSNYTCYAKSGVTYMEKDSDDNSGWIVGGSVLGTVGLIILTICCSLFCFGCFVVFFVIPVILASAVAIIFVIGIVFVAVNLICLTLTGAGLVPYIKNLIKKKYEEVNKTRSSELSQGAV